MHHVQQPPDTSPDQGPPPGDGGDAGPDGGADLGALTTERWGARIHGPILSLSRTDRTLWLGTGVVRDRERRVVSGDHRVTKFGFAPRNQGGTGVTIVEFSA